MNAIAPDCTPQEALLLRREGLDTLAGAFAHPGSDRLVKPGLKRRERIRLAVPDASGGRVVWYLKRYGPEPASRRLWRRLTRRSACPAETEADNVRRIRQAGISTMRVLAVGGEGGGGRSYLVVSAVPGEALERCLDRCLARWDQVQAAAFSAALVDLAARVHLAGLVHRDFYASHIFLDEGESPRLWLIDLARVFQPAWRRFRWQVKDLAALKYSMPPAWVEAHWRGFLTGYLGRLFPGTGAGGGRLRKWDAAVSRKVAWMRRRQRRSGGRR